MSEAPPPISADEAMLNRLAELDLAWVEKVHAQGMAATETDEINSLGRTYQRAARSLRQTLAVKAKLKLDTQAAALKAKGWEPNPVAGFGAKLADLDEDLRNEQRIDDLMDAVGRVIVASTGNEPISTNEAFDRFDREMDDWILDELFGLEELNDHIAEVCEALGLPEDLARQWRKLPKVVFAPDPATNPPAHDASADSPADPPVPNSDTG